MFGQAVSTKYKMPSKIQIDELQCMMRHVQLNNQLQLQRERLGWINLCAHSFDVHQNVSQNANTNVTNLSLQTQSAQLTGKIGIGDMKWQTINY